MSKEEGLGAPTTSGSFANVVARNPGLTSKLEWVDAGTVEVEIDGLEGAWLFAVFITEGEDAGVRDRCRENKAIWRACGDDDSISPYRDCIFHT